MAAYPQFKTFEVKEKFSWVIYFPVEINCILIVAPFPPISQILSSHNLQSCNRHSRPIFMSINQTTSPVLLLYDILPGCHTGQQLENVILIVSFPKLNMSNFFQLFFKRFSLQSLDHLHCPYPTCSRNRYSNQSGI